MSCRSSFDSFSPSQCMKSTLGPNGVEISLEICNDPYYSYCPQTLGNNTCQLPPQEPIIDISAPGEPCNLDINCIDGVCQDNFCQALFQSGWSCIRHTQCQVGYYCDEVCKPQVPVNNICTEDIMCANNCGCYEGICVTYFSIDALMKISSCQNGENFLCKSAACYEYNENYICLPQSKLNATSLFCYFGNECTAELQPGVNFYTKCSCSQNGYGSLMCSLAPGDQIYMEYTNALKNWVNSSMITKCHTTRRMNLQCIKAYWEWEDYVTLAYFQNYALNYTMFNSSDSCVKNVFQSSFWQIEAEYESLKKNKYSIALGLVVGFSLLSL
ncbi:hypothetical protein SteCoe_32245 [Stentor coeruleus]|uniref:Dickkopf N-terminal cysteine-rich domain-containing protein n=1 Tax=Stentor coeruleus TaxID=5963 RepID=A0A1R2AZF6_9CILI|nr:hypothetical protein SteCoe_32245 [Stentor coeruleus]